MKQMVFQNNLILMKHMGWDSAAVGMVMCNGLNSLGIESQWGGRFSAPA
jgi:hypothetical protein